MVMIHDFLNMFLSEFFSFFKGININKTAQTFKVLKVLKVLKNFYVHLTERLLCYF